MAEQLNQLRAKIDAIDNELLELMNARAKLAQAVGHQKGNAVTYRPEREAQVLSRLQQLNAGPLSNERITALFTEIISACRAMEAPLTIAYLGPPGTFSEEAVSKRFGHAVVTIACHSIDDVFRQVESGSAHYGVVPVENSTEGAVGRTMDLLVQTPLVVCGEIELPVHHCLMAKHSDLTQIQKIYSHPQSFGQCIGWLNHQSAQLKSVAQINVASNADAARLAASDPHAAAIASSKAAEIFELTICARNIEDDPNNTTRFLVMGSQRVPVSGKDKTSLAISTHDRPGAVYELLAPLAKYQVSMSRFESRPSRKGLWEYMFFIDLEGHQDNNNIASAIGELRDKATFLKILGSYPAA
ncbi:MAG TPA: prephenate dehydratase [Nitrosomonas sp.]|nr:prephenate dehydratase [Nitrosomonas sp.]